MLARDWFYSERGQAGLDSFIAARSAIYDHDDGGGLLSLLSHRICEFNINNHDFPCGEVTCFPASVALKPGAILSGYVLAPSADVIWPIVAVKEDQPCAFITIVTPT